MILEAMSAWVAGRYYAKRSLRSTEISELLDFCNNFVTGQLTRADLEAAQDVLRQPVRGRLLPIFDRLTVVFAFVEIPNDWYSHSRYEKAGNKKPRFLGTVADRRAAVRPVIKMIRELEEEENIVQKFM